MFFVEPIKDRQTCSKCKLTVRGRKWLYTCERCHAITYCGEECQRDDWDRHVWNCVPAMVKEEIPGKGQGIVAARNIKKGEEIFRDMPVISLNETLNAEDELMVNPEFMTSLRKQINNLRPSETKSKYFKLTPIARANGPYTLVLNVRGGASYFDILYHLSFIYIHKIFILEVFIVGITVDENYVKHQKTPLFTMYTHFQRWLLLSYYL